MELSNPVLLVVDMQNGFLNEHSLPVVSNVLRMVKACSRNRIPILFTAFENKIGSPFERLIGWENVRDVEEKALHESLEPFADTVFTKNFYTAFTPEFDEFVKRQAWTTVLICGVATESCVLKTAVDAFERELRPVVIADSCASDVSEEMHFMGLAVLEILIGKNQIKLTDGIIGSSA